MGAVGVQPSRRRYGEKNMKSYLETSTARFIRIVIEHTYYANPKLPHSLKSESSAPSKPKTWLKSSIGAMANVQLATSARYLGLSFSVR